MNSINQGKPLFVVDGNAEISRAIRNMALALAGKGKVQGSEKEKKAFLGMKL
jgi:Flp pilus assembly CpaE family ATPase